MVQMSQEIDIKVLTQTLKEAIGSNDNGVSFSIVSGVEVNINNGNQDMHKKLSEVIEELPEPKFDNLIKLVLEYSYSKYRGKATKAAEFLGIKKSTISQHAQRVGLTQGSLEENSIC